MINKAEYTRIKIIFLLAIIILLTLSILSYVKIIRLIDTYECVSKSYLIKFKLESSIADLTNMESNERAYILTKDSAFLQSYFSSALNIDLCLKDIDSLTKDNPLQQQNEILLRTLFYNRIDYLKNTLAVSQTSNVITQRDLIQNFLIGNALMGDIRKQVDKMQGEEDKLIFERSSSLNENTLLPPIFTAFLIVGSILIIITSYFKIVQGLKMQNTLHLKLNDTIILLEQKNQELQKVNNELESFNYISNHDLQTPLRQIQTFASRIIDDEQQNLSDKGKTYFDKMNNAAKRMQTLIADLLAYSRTNTVEQKFRMTNLNQIVKEVTEEFAETINEKNATIEVAENCDINVIPFQFRQLMHNLIDNSLKFSKPNIAPHIIITNRNIKSSQVRGANLNSEEEYCHISITDNGIGFEPNYNDLIFEVFQRLHEKQKIAGTGIGLAIVKKIVANHNGIITATSNLNEGATFDIYIPVSQTN